MHLVVDSTLSLRKYLSNTHCDLGCLLMTGGTLQVFWVPSPKNSVTVTGEKFHYYYLLGRLCNVKGNSCLWVVEVQVSAVLLCLILVTPDTTVFRLF